MGVSWYFSSQSIASWTVSPSVSYIVLCRMLTASGPADGHFHPVWVETHLHQEVVIVLYHWGGGEVAVACGL